MDGKGGGVVVKFPSCATFKKIKRIVKASSLLFYIWENDYYFPSTCSILFLHLLFLFSSIRRVVVLMANGLSSIRNNGDFKLFQIGRKSSGKIEF